MSAKPQLLPQQTRVRLNPSCDFTRTHFATGTEHNAVRDEGAEGVVDTYGGHAHWVVFDNGYFGWFDRSQLIVIVDEDAAQDAK